MHVAVLERVKETIALDEDFNMASWEHCIGAHICRNNGDRLSVHYGYVEKANGKTQNISIRASEILGIAPYEGIRLFSTCQWPQSIQRLRADRWNAIRAIDAFIEEHKHKGALKRLMSVDMVGKPVHMQLEVVAETNWPDH